MRIDPREEITGVPVLEVRKILRYLNRGTSFSTRTIAEHLDGSERRARRLVTELRARNYIGPAEYDPAEWSITREGQAFCIAPATRPIKRATAERLLAGVLERVQFLADLDAHPYAYRVGRLVVFGSYLRDVTTLGDVDIGVEWVPRFADNAQQHQYGRERIRLAYRAGRRFSNISDELFWPWFETRQYLKARSGYLSLHDLVEERAFIESVPYRVLYEATPGTIPPAVAPG